MAEPVDPPTNAKQSPADAKRLPTNAKQSSPADAQRLPTNAKQSSPADAQRLPTNAKQSSPADAQRLPTNAKRSRSRSRSQRFHLLELEDQPWLPTLLRDYATDWLRAVAAATNSHRVVAPLVERLLRETGERRIVDLCSGGGGPVRGLVEELRRRGVAVEATLTDLYPNRLAFATERAAGMEVANDPVDARAVPAELRGIRTLFNAAHHFRPADLRTILADAAAASQPIVIAEIVRRTVSAVLSMALVPLLVWAMTPAIRPFRWSRLVLTYPLPAVPAICLWDGVVSQLRAYRAHELLALAEDAAPSHTWRSGVLRAGPAPVTFLVGQPPRAPTEALPPS